MPDSPFVQEQHISNKEPTGSLLTPMDFESIGYEKKHGNIKLIALLVTVVALATSAALWASTEHSNIRMWTADQNYSLKRELVEIFDKNYVPRTDFIKVKSSQNHMEETIKKMNDKIEEIHRYIILGKRPRHYDSKD